MQALGEILARLVWETKAVAVQVPSRLVVEWPLQASLEAGLPLLLLPNAQLAAGEKVEDGDGQLSCSNMICIMLPPTL